MNIVSFSYAVEEAPTLERIFALERAMLAMPERQIDAPVFHHFSPGIYARELFIPKGATLTGQIHLTEHLSMLIQGDITVLTDGGMFRLQAPWIGSSKPGMKRAGYAHEDTRWVTIHASTLTDLKELERELVTNDVNDPRLPAEFRRLLA